MFYQLHESSYNKWIVCVCVCEGGKGVGEAAGKSSILTCLSQLQEQLLIFKPHHESQHFITDDGT